MTNILPFLAVFWKWPAQTYLVHCCSEREDVALSNQRANVSNKFVYSTQKPFVLLLLLTLVKSLRSPDSNSIDMYLLSPSSTSSWFSILLTNPKSPSLY
jgi:hypothetical protein